MISPGPWVVTNTMRRKLLDNTFRLTLDDWKCALVLATSNIGVGSTAWAGVTNEHANANGYITGGVEVAFSPSGSMSVDIDWVSPPYWVAVTGSIVARRAVIYKEDEDVLAFCLLNVDDADVIIAAGSKLQLNGSLFGLPAEEPELGVPLLCLVLARCRRRWVSRGTPVLLCCRGLARWRGLSSRAMPWTSALSGAACCRLLFQFRGVLEPPPCLVMAHCRRRWVSRVIPALLHCRGPVC